MISKEEKDQSQNLNSPLATVQPVYIHAVYIHGKKIMHLRTESRQWLNVLFVTHTDSERLWTKTVL